MRCEVWEEMPWRHVAVHEEGVCFLQRPSDLSAHSRGSVYLKPIQVSQNEDQNEGSPSTSECLHEKKACEDELTHQLDISAQCQSEQADLECKSQECQQQNEYLDSGYTTCQQEKFACNDARVD